MLFKITYICVFQSDFFEDNEPAQSEDEDECSDDEDNDDDDDGNDQDKKQDAQPTEDKSLHRISTGQNVLHIAVLKTHPTEQAAGVNHLLTTLLTIIRSKAQYSQVDGRGYTPFTLAIAANNRVAALMLATVRLNRFRIFGG